MPSVQEATGAGSQLNASLEAGVNTLSLNQVVLFTQYVRRVLPLDGFIFWLKTSTTREFMGSLHYSVNSEQREDEDIAIRNVIFTSQELVTDLAEIAPSTLWIADIDEDRYAFSQQGNFYEQAGLYHYQGYAIWPAMETQLVDDVGDLDLVNQVVSNSLPIWLTLNSIMPVYPSFLVPADLRPPYAAVHIDPASTKAIQSAPYLALDLSHYQLAEETVKITIYGLRNNDALDFQDYVFQYSLDTDNIGIMNMPIIRDEKRTQSETSTIAQKKSIEFKISYYQARLNDATRQFILQSIQSYIVNHL
jgi:hypothetical protein